MSNHNRQGLRALHVATKKDDVSALKLLISEKWNVNERTSNGYTPLHIAAKHGSINAANYLIDQGAELNTPAKHNIVPLHVAARHGQSGVLTILIEAGANLSVATKDGLSALHCAARDGNSRCVELLVVHGAPITAKTRHGLTALHTASQGNHTASAKHLLTHGAHIDDITLDGVTPLHITAHYGHFETAQLLIEKGADIDKRAKNGYTALHIASKKNRENIVQLLLQHKSSVHIKNNNGQTALHVAAFFGHVNIVLLLLQSGAFPEAKTIREETVIHIACHTTQIQIVRLLIRNSANVNAVSKDGDTPLHIACLQGSSSLVSLLLDNGANPNAVNLEGCSALHLASRDGYEVIVESLLDHHADVFLMSKRGFTAVHEAAKKGHIEILNMLLAKKADVNAKGKNDLTPLHVACHYDQPDVAVKLLAHGANPHDVAKNGFTCLHISSKNNQVNIVSLLLERGVEANMMTRNGVSPLHLASREGNVEIVDMLLEHGASPGAQTINGLTPLHMAVQYNQAEVVQTLIKYGAAINVPTQTGFTPLHLAAMFGYVHIAEMLLNENAEVEAKTKNGNTALHIAAHKGHGEVVDLLLRFNAPPNALNKDGLSALSIAETLQVDIIIKKLIHVTKISLSKKYANNRLSDSPKSKWDKVRQSFLSPELLEEPLLVDAIDEAEDEAYVQKKIIQEDFDETFAGLDETRSETRSELNKSIHTVTEERISMTSQHQVENMAGGNFNDYLQQLETNDNSQKNVESFIKGLDDSDVLTSEKSPVKSNGGKFDNLGNGGMFQNIDRDNYDNMFSSSDVIAKENELPKSALKESGFLISFLVDARGGVMESRQTGIKFTVPKGACCMPIRMTCRLKRPDMVVKRHDLQLNFNESLVSKIAYISPEETQFLKPVVLEIPHYAAVNKSERELVVLRKNANSTSWQEHSTTLFDKLNGNRLRVILQDLPEMLVVISRPFKQRCVMQPEGGTIDSQVVTNTQVIIPPDTLNTSTKVILQVQPCDELLLHLDNHQTYLSPIVSLMPNTNLSKPITINIPCDWLLHEEKNSRKNLRLLSWLTKSPRKSFNGMVEYEWQDITNKTPLSIVGENASFTTTEFTRYWLLQTNSVETLPKRINQIQETVSVAPFSCRIRVFARNKWASAAILRFELALDNTHEHYSHVKDHSYQEVGCSDLLSVYRGQTVYINISGNLAAQNTQSLKLTLKPFFVNRLSVPVIVVALDTPKTCRLTFLGSLRKNSRHNNPTLCSLDVNLTDLENSCSSPTYPDDTVNDSIIQTVGNALQDDWINFSDELGLNNRDKQAVCDISSGRHDVASIRLLEFWRSKHPAEATYKKLHDALKRFGKIDQAENVINASPNKFSLEVEPRTQSPTKDISNPFLNLQFVSNKMKTSPIHSPLVHKSPNRIIETEEQIPTDHLELKDPEINFDSIYFEEPLTNDEELATLDSAIHSQGSLDTSSNDSSNEPFEMDYSPNQSDFTMDDEYSLSLDVTDVKIVRDPNDIIEEDILNELEVKGEETALDFTLFENENSEDTVVIKQNEQFYASDTRSAESSNAIDIGNTEFSDKPQPTEFSMTSALTDNINGENTQVSSDNINENYDEKNIIEIDEKNKYTLDDGENIDTGVIQPTNENNIEITPDIHVMSDNHATVTSEATIKDTPSIDASTANDDESGDEIIKKMFGNQASVLDFFNDEQSSSVDDNTPMKFGKIQTTV